MTGTVAYSMSAFLRPSPPRGISRSITPACVATSRSSSRPPPATITTASGGTPTLATASRASSLRIAFELSAIDDPRSTIAFPDLIASAVQSIVTLGRDSYTTATTPSGTRTLRTSSPFGSRNPSMTSPTGSRSVAMSRTWAAIAPTRASSSIRRSSSAALRPASRPASMSRALASTISSTRAASASAIACRAASFAAVSSDASRRAAARAATHTSVTDRAATAMERRLGEHEIVAVDRFLGRPGQHLAHLGGLHARHLAQLVRGVVADPLRHDATAIGTDDLHGVTGIEGPAHLDDPDRKQAGAAVAQRPRSALVDDQRAVRGLGVLQPELERRVALRPWREPRPLRPVRQRRAQRTLAQPVADHRRDAGRGCHLRGDDLRAHPAGAQRRGSVPDLQPLQP